MSRALERVLHERGSDIRYGQRVTEVVIETGRATGVRTAAGLEVSADVVISNASAPTTMLELVGREHLPSEYVTRVERPQPSYTTFAVYLGLSRDVFAEHGLPHEVFIYDGYDQDAAWDAAFRGDWSRAALTITDYTHVDPGCAPAGWGNVVITAAAPWDYEDVWGTAGDLTHYHSNPRYLELKERVADLLVARAEDHVPGLVAATRHGEASSPLTNFEYTRNPRRRDRRLRKHTREHRAQLASRRDTDPRPVARRGLDEQRRANPRLGLRYPHGAPCTTDGRLGRLKTTQRRTRAPSSAPDHQLAQTAARLEMPIDQRPSPIGFRLQPLATQEDAGCGSKGVRPQESSSARRKTKSKNLPRP